VGSNGQAPLRPRVSVCLPVYNGADTIERSVASVLNQTYTDFECLVVDNCSSDGTVDRVRRFDDPRIRIVRNAANLGLVGNHNECLRQARGDLIQFVHSDDWLLPNCLERLVPAFDAEDVGLAFAPRVVESDDESWKALYGELHTSLEPMLPIFDGQDVVRRYVRAGAEGNWIGEPPSVMVRRETLAAVGGFRSDFIQLTDMDAWLRVLSRSNAAWVGEALSVRWHHAGSQTDANQKPGSALIDQMWVTSSIARNAALARSIRARALGLWMKCLLRSSAELVSAPKAQRSVRWRGLHDHVRKAFSAHAR
jgi:GT2 family glycosyltransferase